jgi:hypothetical protein
MGSVGTGTTVEDNNFSDTPVVRSMYVVPFDVIAGADSVIPYRMTSDWRPDVERLIEEADAAIIDVSALSEHVQWEIDTALEHLPIQRVIFVATNSDFEHLKAFAATKPERELVLRATQIGYATSYWDRLKLRWRLLRIFNEMC